ncbi:MAG: sigma 54-interacting transcriptional regulator, partial [Gemmatimonadales bacterium]
HLELQAKLLRILETGVVERVGGESGKRVDVRVLAATNQDLMREVEAGAFREDLFYRLSVFPIVVPPLRDRLEDLPALVRHLADVTAARCNRPALAFSPGALQRMRTHDWPGNVRELANLVERLTIVGEATVVSEMDVANALQRAPRRRAGRAREQVTLGLTAALDAYEADLISHAIAASDGNVAEAARRLQTDRANLYRRMRRLGLGRKHT